MKSAPKFMIMISRKEHEGRREYRHDNRPRVWATARSLADKLDNPGRGVRTYLTPYGSNEPVYASGSTF